MTRLSSLDSLSLSLQLAPLLLFDLFHGLEEELLNVTALVENHLSECLQIGALLDLHLIRLSQSLQLFILLLDDLLILELYQFALLFKVTHNLIQ